MRVLLAKLLIGLLSFLVVIVTVLTFVGYIGSWRYFEMFSDYRPFLLVAGVVLLLGAALLLKFVKAWRNILLGAAVGATVVTLVNTFEVLPWLLANPREKAPSDVSAKTIKLLAFNLEGDGPVNKSYTETRAFVRQESPDIAMFCECGHGWPDELQSLTNELPHHVRIPAMDIDVFSRHPMVRTQVFHFGPRRGFVVVGVSVKGMELSFVATHTYSRHWVGDQGFAWRNEALEIGIGKLLADAPRPLVVMGDLNVGPWSPVYKRMMKASGFNDARRGHGLLVTHHGHGAISKLLWKPIDHCLFSAELEVNNIHTGPDLTSYHLPVVAEFVLPDRR